MTKEKIILTRRQIKNYMFYLAYFSQVINVYVLGYTTLVYSSNTIIKLIQITNKYISLSLIIGIVFYQINRNMYRKKSLYIALLFVVITIISAIKSSNYNIFYALIFTIAAVDIDHKKFLKYDIIFKILCISCVFVLCRLNIIENYIYYKDNRIVESLGFTHPNFLAISIAFLVIEYMCYKNNKLKIKNYIILIVISLLQYRITGSITGMLIIIFCILLSLLCNCSVVMRNLINGMSKYMYIICSTLFLIFAINYNLFTTFIVEKFGSNMLSRLIYANRAINEYGLRIFGQRIRLISNEAAQEAGVSAFILDSSYIRLISIYGILIFIIFGVVYYKLAKYFEKNGLIGSVIAIIVILICGISESHMLIFQINFLFILFGSLLRRRET